MNDEIKEILDNIKKCCDIDKDANWVAYEKDKILYLLDYITNLQQKYEEADNDRHKLFEQKEKAVEYINNNLLYSEDFDYDEEDNLVWQGARCDTQSEDLLNILNGKE